MEEKQADKTSVGVFVIALGVFAGVLLMAAGLMLYDHGQNMAAIQSKAGATGESSIMEAYYNETGHCNKAFGVAAIGMGAGVIAISVGMGAALMKQARLKSPAELVEAFKEGR